MGARAPQWLAMPLLVAFLAGKTLLCSFLCVASLEDGAGEPFPEAGEAGGRNPQTPRELTERHWLVDLEAAEDPVHVAGVSEAVTSDNYLKWFWNKE